MEELFLNFPCRNKQIQLLNQFLGKKSRILPPLLYVYGQAAVGKTTILLEYLKTIKSNYAYINCIECYTNRLLLESILSQILDESIEEKCDNFMDFLHIMKNVSKDGRLFNETTVIVLDGIEYLHESTNGNSLAVFAKLQELTSIFSLCVIFVSKLLPEKFFLEPFYIPLHFPQYTRDDFFCIFKNYKPLECDDQFFESYLNAALTVFFRTTRDFTEMKNLVMSNFPKYCEPVEKGELIGTDVNGLWRHIVPRLKESLNSVYLGVVSRQNESISEKTEELITSKQSCVFDLPYYAKYLLIAAYLASYNSPKYDRLLFLKNHGKQKKRNIKSKAKDNLTNELLGPKLFPLDRLLSIFYRIMEDDKASLTVNLMSQIASLVELRLLARSGESSIENPKYKCLVGLECVDKVARTLGFNVHKYLME
ncbi:hypothetical protein O3M35_012814 [Rhynocoris fuscipes]|uniref:Origin recognition complex subunit 5 n=1 Tax=Rhynocoris fuscipes TaxID=488301 RepID=A0AAW1CKP1_9HEMI